MASPRQSYVTHSYVFQTSLTTHAARPRSIQHRADGSSCNSTAPRQVRSCKTVTARFAEQVSMNYFRRRGAQTSPRAIMRSKLDRCPGERGRRRSAIGPSGQSISLLAQSTQCSRRTFRFLLPVTSKLSNHIFRNSLNSRGMMSAFHSNSNTEAMTSFPVFNTSASSAPRTQRGSDFPLEVTVEHIVEVHTGSQASHEKESDLSDDRFVLSQAVFDSEKRKESV